MDKLIGIGPQYTVLGGTPWTIPNIGTPIDNMAGAYQRYINRVSKQEGIEAIKNFQAAGRDFVNMVPPLYEYLYAQLKEPAPNINVRLRTSIKDSINSGSWDVFSALWTTLMHLCQQWSVREELVTHKQMRLKIEFIYEMYWVCKDLLDLSELVPTEPDKGLIDK